ncbi:MAG: four helix bundle suffix domain-containing protein [Kiritimatiellaeota bacterium]|nr:four helix bundle suffix domain-containing protein [Kiritimatiellota bacterium]
MNSGDSILPPHGGYEQLLSYQKSVLVYDGTVAFCRRFLRKGDRTVDQMTQAARSCKQNIVEASQASGTSKETEIKLTNVARASLEELLEDYRDFLRTHNAPLWDKDSAEAVFVREESKKPHGRTRFPEVFETRPADVLANVMICLVKLTNYLLDRQIRALEAAFIKEGGLRERMTQARKKARGF